MVLVPHIRETNRAWSKYLPKRRNLAQEICALAAKSERIEGNVSVLLAGDRKLKQLNRDFRGKDKPTNVLSFPSGEAMFLGDIALSIDTLKREAKEQGKKLEHHFAHLLLHGILHLLGYDHEKARDAEKMEKKEIQILKKLGLGNPYQARYSR